MDGEQALIARDMIARKRVVAYIRPGVMTELGAPAAAERNVDDGLGWDSASEISGDASYDPFMAGKLARADNVHGLVMQTGEVTVAYPSNNWLANDSFLLGQDGAPADGWTFDSDQWTDGGVLTLPAAAWGRRRVLKGISPTSGTGVDEMVWRPSSMFPAAVNMYLGCGFQIQAITTPGAAGVILTAGLEEFDIDGALLGENSSPDTVTVVPNTFTDAYTGWIRMGRLMVPTSNDCVFVRPLFKAGRVATDGSVCDVYLRSPYLSDHAVSKSWIMDCGTINAGDTYTLATRPLTLGLDPDEYPFFGGNPTLTATPENLTNNSDIMESTMRVHGTLVMSGPTSYRRYLQVSFNVKNTGGSNDDVKLHVLAHGI